MWVHTKVAVTSLAKQPNSLPPRRWWSGTAGALEEVLAALLSSRMLGGQAVLPVTARTILPFSQLFAALCEACGLAFPSFPARAPTAPSLAVRDTGEKRNGTQRETSFLRVRVCGS